jgi:uncharacterized phage protein gp47/JayE
MPLFAESQEKIFADILYEVVNNTVITRSSPGSKMRALTEALSKKLGIMYNTFDLNVTQAFINGARGRYLDFIGSMFNVQRLGETRARISSTDLNLKFYTDVGTFGTINGASSILIPAGTIVSSLPNGEGTKYRLPVGVILDSAESVTYVPAEALQAGPVANVGKNTLKFHDFTNYADNTNSTLKVTNEADISTGAPVESEANYRFRISNQVIAAESANATAVRLAALNVPGVSDVILLPQDQGIRSFGLLVQSITPTVPASLVSAVQTTVDRVMAYGITSTVRAPVQLGISVKGSLKLRKSVSSSERNTILSTVTANVTDYLNNLRVGEDFILNELIERVMASSTLIKNLGIPGQPFDELYLWSPTRLNDNRVSSSLVKLGNYTPQSDEKISVENMNSPVVFEIV